MTAAHLRHANIATTAGYTFITSTERSDAIAALPDLELAAVPLRLLNPVAVAQRFTRGAPSIARLSSDHHRIGGYLVGRFGAKLALSA